MSLMIEKTNMQKMRGIQTRTVIATVLHEFGIYNTALIKALQEKISSTYHLEPNKGKVSG